VLGGCDVDVVEVEDVLVDVLDVEVLEVDVLEVPGGVFGPQNCTLEMAGGWWLFPASGSPLFENEPVTCGGAIEYRTDDGPPFTMIAEIGVVELHHAPESEVCDSVTTFSLPAGFSNWYGWSSLLNFAISVVPCGHDWLPPLKCDDVVCTMPARTRSAPRTIMIAPGVSRRLQLDVGAGIVCIWVSGFGARSFAEARFGTFIGGPRPSQKGDFGPISENLAPPRAALTSR
jgi:hypothetical protein